MWLGARLPSAKLTLFSRPSTASGATNRQYLFWTEFFFHGGEMMPPNPSTGMVNLEQLWQITWPFALGASFKLTPLPRYPELNLRIRANSVRFSTPKRQTLNLVQSC